MDLQITAPMLKLFSVEIQAEQLTHAVLYVNDFAVEQLADNSKCRWELDFTPTNVRIMYFPFGIEPKVRVNNFLLNNWLANILIEDHQLTFNVGEDFFDRYREKDIHGRVQSLASSDMLTLDRNVGVFLHEEIVNNIKHLINEKSNNS